MLRRTALDIFHNYICITGIGRGAGRAVGHAGNERPDDDTTRRCSCRKRSVARPDQSALDAGQPSCLIRQIIAQTAGLTAEAGVLPPGWLVERTDGQTSGQTGDDLTNRITVAHVCV